MQDTTIQLPFNAWDIVVGVLQGLQMAAGAMWGGLDTFGRFVVVVLLILWLVLPPSKESVPARRFPRRRCYRREWED